MDIVKPLFDEPPNFVSVKIIKPQDPVIIDGISLSRGFTPAISSVGNYRLLTIKKNQIDHCGPWFNKYRSMTNPFELVAGNSRKYKSATNMQVISRAYFKLWEILQHFDILPDTPILYAALAEAPGGFVQAVMDFRMKKLGRRLHDQIFGITLNTGEGLKWKWSAMWRRQFKINYGDPRFNDGDLINPYNIIAYACRLNLGHLPNPTSYVKIGGEERPLRAFIQSLIRSRKAHLVTADGGTCIDEGVENYQEQIHFPLFFNEVLTALLVQADGGNFILKIYDIFTIPTLQLLQLLSKVYKSVYLVKPQTSRPANSEKYVICINYLGSEIADIETIVNSMIDHSFKMYRADVNLNSNPNAIYVQSIGTVNVSEEFIDSIRYFNSTVVSKQLDYIDATIKLITAIGNKNTYMYSKTKDKIQNRQFEIGRQWCIENNIEPAPI